MATYYSATTKELTEKTKIPLLVMNAPGDVHVEYAVQMISEIVENNKQQKNTVFIFSPLPNSTPFGLILQTTPSPTHKPKPQVQSQS